MKESVADAAEEWLDEERDDQQWLQYATQHGYYFPEKTVAEQLTVYLPPLLLTLGTLGNLLTAVVLARLVRKVLSTCLYVVVAQVLDLLVLYMFCGNAWLQTVARIDVAERAMLANNSLCKIWPFVRQLALHLSMWMTAAMSLETTLVLTRPARLMRFCRMERARAVILLILVLLICVNVHAFWTYALSTHDNSPNSQQVCSMRRQGSNQRNDNFRHIVWPVLDFLVADFLPYFITFACTVTQITVRVKRKDHLRQLENTWKAYSVDSVAARELQLAFLALCLAHLFLLLPKMACDMFKYLLQFLVSYSFRLDSKRLLAEGLAGQLLYLHLSTKFLVLLGCCQTLRCKVWALLACCCQGRQKQQRRPPPPATRQPLLTQPNNETRPNHELPLNHQPTTAPTTEALPYHNQEPLAYPSQEPQTYMSQDLLAYPSQTAPPQTQFESNSMLPSPRKAFSMTSV